MHEWMPGPISQASHSQGGTSTIKENKETVDNMPFLMRLEEGGKKRIMRRPTLKWPEKGISTTPHGGADWTLPLWWVEERRRKRPAPNCRGGADGTLPLQLKKEFG